MKQKYDENFINDIIRMAWADDVSFDKIKKDRGLSESEIIKIMRSNLKAGSFKLWRKRASGRSSKHEKRTKLLTQSLG
ncbi:MAG: TIGR03643 family protein [Pseudomonadota bacterium]